MRYPVSAYLIIDMRNIFRNEFSQSEKRFLGEEGPAATTFGMVVIRGSLGQLAEQETFFSVSRKFQRDPQL